MSCATRSWDEFPELVRPLLGLPVSRPWKGDYYAVFLELGALTSKEILPGRSRNYGEAHIDMDVRWRVESGSRILFGSSLSRPKIRDWLETLEGVTIGRMAVTSGVPDLEIGFSNGQTLRSLIQMEDDLSWSIKLQDGRWLSPKGGLLSISNG